MYRLIDLFSGAGGLTAGLVAASPKFLPAAHVDIEIDAVATYAQNFSSSEPLFGDLRTFVKEEILPSADIVVGGPPCQGFSTLGKRNDRDEKNELWRYFATAVRQIKPKYFVIENVPQFLKSTQYGIFQKSVYEGELRDYEIAVHKLNVAHFGTPQNRIRMIILGTRKGLPKLDLPRMKDGLLPSKTVRDAIGNIDFDVEGIDLPDRKLIFMGKKLKGCFLSQELHLGRRYSPISLKRFEFVGKDGGSRKDIPFDLLAPCWQKNPTSASDVMGRLRWDSPSVTIRTEFFKPEKGRYLHPVAHRAITHYEAILLMGFSPDYRWVGTKTSIARQIGNAVPPALGRAIGGELIHLLDMVEG